MRLSFSLYLSLNSYPNLPLEMKIKSITINNFRLLEEIKLNFERDITLIVGKNNTGKTSFFEAINFFALGSEIISFEDFSQATYSQFKTFAVDYLKSIVPGLPENEKEELEMKIQKGIPRIELLLTFEYDKAQDSLIELSEFITDLDDARCDATILLTFEPKNSIGLYTAFFCRQDKKVKLIKFLKEAIGNFYHLKCYAVDSKSDFKREIEGSFKDKIKRVVSFEDIKALRVLDDKKGDRNNTLSLGFSNYYKERDKTDNNVQTLEKSLKDISVDLKEKYNVVLEKILVDLKKFGASTPIVIPDITIESEFNSEAVIKNNIKYYYKHTEIDLPESYNGLGYSNLIYMVLELASFIERFRNAKEEKLSEFLVVMIEEPEAHMHPQMQQVFISQIKGILREAHQNSIYVQLIITSHSSHILSEAGIDLERGFNRIRYFNKINGKVCAQDFNELKIINDKKTFRFLKQYLTLHKSDIFFSDKVILVEGTTERMLLPQMIAKAAPDLQKEYVSILEVGGAYSHKFQEILEFIGVKTLIITDLDSVDANGEKCPVGKAETGKISSNETLCQWLPGKTILSELIACVDADKIKNEIVRVAYQNEENSHYSRSFEEAFICCNKNLILGTSNIDGVNKVHKNEFSLFRTKNVESITAAIPYDLAPETSKAKTNFAFDIMSFQEDSLGEWHVPKYIKEGLEWLAKSNNQGNDGI
jgi:putative ATP-dependent endonuclease of OLD family